MVNADYVSYMYTEYTYSSQHMYVYTIMYTYTWCLHINLCGVLTNIALHRLKPAIL